MKEAENKPGFCSKLPKAMQKAFFASEQGIRFARLRTLGRSRSQQPTGLLLCTARPSNPVHPISSKKIKGSTLRHYLPFFWRRARDSNPRSRFATYTSSSRAPSTNSDNSPYALLPSYYTRVGYKNQGFLQFIFNLDYSFIGACFAF